MRTCRSLVESRPQLLSGGEGAHGSSSHNLAHLRRRIPSCESVVLIATAALLHNWYRTQQCRRPFSSSSGLDGEHETETPPIGVSGSEEGAIGNDAAMGSNRGIRLTTTVAAGRRFQRKSLLHRGKGWPWISVVPSEASPAYFGRRVEKSKDAPQEAASSPSPPGPNGDGFKQNPRDTSFPRIYGTSDLDHVSNLLPKSVPLKIQTSLSKYGWSAHTVLELRTLMAQGTKLKSSHVLEILTKQKDANIAYNFLMWALEEGKCKLHIKCFTVVLILVGRVRNYNLLERLLEVLREKGYPMDKFIFTAAMRCYAEGHKMQEAMDLFVKMKERGFRPDCVTYTVLMQMFSKARLYQEALKLYDEMLAQGIATDTQLYNCVVRTFGKAGRLDLAYKKLEEMRERGHIPDQFTYGILLEGYAKAGRSDFMDLYREMHGAGIPVNEVIFNIMLSGVERLGNLGDAERLFMDMEKVGLSANLNAFSTLISMCSKNGNAEGAQAWFDKMASMGLQPTLAIANSLLNSYSTAKRFDQAERVLDSFRSWGIAPNLPTLTVCLRCLTLCEKPEDLEVVQRMLACHHSGSQFLAVLLGVDGVLEKKNLAAIVGSFLGSLHSERKQSRRDFVSVLIDYLYKSGFRSQAYMVWEASLANYMFPTLVEQGPEGICSVNLRGMECGTAIVALTHTLPRLAKQFHRKEMTPEWVQIYTTVQGSEEDNIPGTDDPKSVHSSVKILLEDLRSPFYAGTLQTGGGFVCRGEDVMSWVDEPETKAMLKYGPALI